MKIEIIKQEYEKYLSPIKQLSFIKNKIVNDQLIK
jgi:hypothetical protein